MNTLEIDKNILNIIKYGAAIPIVIFSFIITYWLIQQKNYELKEEVTSIKTKFLTENKKVVKDEVLKVINSLNYEIKKSDEELKKFLKEKVYEAHQIATNIYLEESNHEENGHAHSKEHIFKTIKHALGGMLYNKGRGYIFLDDVNGIKLLQPLNKEFEGRNLLEYEDAKGYKFVKKIVNTIKNKTEAFDEYYWYKPKQTNQAYKKISFYKYFEPFNIAIGTGEYLVDFENELKERLLDRIRNLRFGNNGYIFAFDNKGTYLSHFKEENIGINGFNIKDAKNNFFIKDLSDFARKNKKGYVSYTASATPNSVIESREKISFVIHFEKWDWVLGAGFYLEELTQDISEKEKKLKETYQNTINNILLLSLISTVLLLILSFYASKIIANKFKIYKENIRKEIEKTIEKDKLLIQQSKLATMGEMIGNIAHQWRQPLSAISTSATGSKIQKEMNILSDEDFYKAMDSINDSSQFLSQTIEDFRSFFNPNKTKENFKITSIFAKTSTLLCSQFKNYEIEIINEFTEFELYEYKNELLQVLLNILKNAKDELVKKDRANKRLIFIFTSIEDNKCLIKIRDNAGGISEENIERVFDPYFSTKSNSEGTGIGLYMSKQIIEKMNGKIYVTNIEYEYEGLNCKGAEFNILIPI